MKRFHLFLFCVLLSTTAFAYDGGELIVTGSVEPVTLSESGSSVVLISSEDIKEKNPSSMEELLGGIPSLSVYSSGTGSFSIGIRGAATRHTMIMVDGVPFQDPSGFGGMSLWMLPPSMVDRVEVVSGPASAMYGSGAMSGVVNIITKKEQKKGAEIAAGAGSYGAYSLDARASNEYLTIGGSYHYEKGVSSLSDNDESDPFNKGTLYAKQYLELGSYSHTVYGAFSQAHYNFDPDNSYTDQHVYQLVFSPSYEVNKYWTPSISAGYIESYRETYDTSMLAGGSSPDSDFRGITVFTGLNNKITLHKRAVLSLGGKWTQDSADTTYTVGKQEADTWEGFLNGTFKPLDGWNIFAGGRYANVDGKEGDADKFVYSANTSYLVKPLNLTLRGGYGTAFKAPSLVQLYEPLYGSGNLKYEESTIWEIGFRHSLLDNMIVWGVTYFNSEFDDQIYFDTLTTTFKNKDSKSEGVEVELNIYTDYVAFNAAYTYADMTERDTGVKQKPLRRPDHKFSAALTVYPLEGLSAKLEVIYTDETNDKEYVGRVTAPVVHDSYTLINFYVSYDIMEDLNVYGKILNLTDEKYTTAAGYENKRIDLHAGVKYLF